MAQSNRRWSCANPNATILSQAWRSRYSLVHRDRYVEAHTGVQCNAACCCTGQDTISLTIPHFCEAASGDSDLLRLVFLALHKCKKNSESSCHNGWVVWLLRLLEVILVVALGRPWPGCYHVGIARSGSLLHSNSHSA